MPCDAVLCMEVKFSSVDYRFCLYQFLSFQISLPHFDFVTAPTKSCWTYMFRISWSAVTQEICTTNNSFELLRIFDSKTKIIFHSRTENTWFTPGIEVWSADRNVGFFFDSHGYERKQILIWNMVFGLVPTPAKHFLLVHINLHGGWTSIKDWK